MEKLLIGTGTMDSITQGLYHNPRNIYREYIQNAADSIDEAEKLGVLEHGKGKITVDIQPEVRKITISDNGTGIPANKIEQRLYSIGASLKNRDSARGFRGIGHFSGISCCDTLSFVTSAKGEATKTTLTFNAAKIRDNRFSEDKDLVTLMNETTKIIQEWESPDAHYFTVEMSGVMVSARDHDLTVNVLDTESVKNYLIENAPIDFDAQKFFPAEKIKREFSEKGYVIPCYRIFLNGRNLPLYKAYTSEVYTEKKKEPQRVVDIETVYQTASDGKPLYIGWLALADFQKITDATLGGIRLRKGNLLVGDGRTFSVFFSEGQDANQTFMGEIHVLHPGVVLNSERVNFERNSLYDELCQKLTKWAADINRKYRRGMADINASRTKIRQVIGTKNDIENDLESGRLTEEEAEKKQEKLNKVMAQAITKIEKVLEQNTLDFNPEKKQEVQAIVEKYKDNSTSNKQTGNRSSSSSTKRGTVQKYTAEEILSKVIACIEEVITDDELADKLIERIKSIK